RRAPVQRARRTRPGPRAAARRPALAAMSDARDTTPALGTHGDPASWQRARPDAPVAQQRRRWQDAAWSFLYKDDTRYAPGPADPDAVAAAARRMRGGELGAIHGPLIHEPVWTWEVPLYLWFGGMATGSWFVSVACDLAGDHR